MQTNYYNLSKFLSLSIFAVLLTNGNIPDHTLETGTDYMQSKFEISLELSFEGQGEAAFLQAYIPESDGRQQILLMNNDPAGFELRQTTDVNGRRLEWSNLRFAGSKTIRYAFQFSGTAASYEIPVVQVDRDNYPANLSSFLMATPSIPAENSFIRRQAIQLARDQPTVSAIIKAFHSYTSSLSDQPGPAFTSLFYGRKDWKNFLLMALCRARGIPARVVNGIEIQTASEYQMRQWAEVYINDKWIPFDAGANYYAYLPGHYLTLYRGELPALAYSSNLNVKPHLVVTVKEGLIGSLR